MGDSPKSNYQQVWQDSVVPELDKMKGPRTWRLLATSGDKCKNIEPEMYLAAIAELLVTTIVVSFGITFTYDWITGSTMLSDNPIRNMVGYNNPCAFWDQPPALYFAALTFCPMVYLGIRYAVLDSVRADLTFGRHRKVYTIINWTYAASQCIVMGIFVVTPIVRQKGEHLTPEEIQMMHTHMRLHSFCFLQLVPCLCLAISANFIEGQLSGKKLSNLQWSALICYIITTTMETICASYAVFGYKGTYAKEDTQFYQLNPLFMQFVDYSWFLSLPIVTILQPIAPNIIISCQLVEEAPRFGDTEAVIGKTIETF